MAEDKSTPPETDDWLADFETAGKIPEDGPLDQDNIDHLLDGFGDDGAPAEGGAEAAGGGATLDQTSLDALLADSGEEPPAASDVEADPEEGSVELDQAALDALLTSSGSEASAPAAPGEAAADLDQATLDTLLGNDDEIFQAALDEGGNVPSQSDIDELFAQAQHEGGPKAPPREEDFDLGELFGSEDTKGAPLEEDGFGLGTVGFETTAASVAGKRPKPATLGRADQEEDIFNEETVAIPGGGTGGGWPHWPPASMRKAAGKPLWAALAVLFLLAAGGGAYFYAGRAPEPPAGEVPRTAALPPESGKTKPVPAAPPVNTPPEARGAEYEMAAEGGEVPLLLAAKDSEGDPLRYEITTPPRYGRLAGELPMPVYLPSKEFPGDDLVEYRVSDGKELSEPATILITGPDLRPREEEADPTPKVIAPKRPILQAHDITLKTVSTRELVIDWKKIWQQANQQPYAPEIGVELRTAELKGQLTEIGAGRHRYVPERLFRGSEIIGYRFRQGEASSKEAELRLVVDLGDYPPEIRFRSPAEPEHQVGDTVVLDASATRDDDPETLCFAWQQLAGTPVKMALLNSQGSIISFVVPSFFSTEENPGPVLRLTATDRSGQSDVKTVKISARSRRHSPLWPGVAAGERSPRLLPGSWSR